MHGDRYDNKYPKSAERQILSALIVTSQPDDVTGLAPLRAKKKILQIPMILVSIESYAYGGSETYNNLRLEMNC